MTTIHDLPAGRSAERPIVVRRGPAWRSSRPAWIRHAWIQSESAGPSDPSHPDEAIALRRAA